MESIVSDIPDVVGLFGVVLVLLWYMLLQLEKCKATDLSFSLANSLGSVCLLYSLLYHWNLSMVVIESIWLLISLYGIFKVFFLKKTVNL